MTTTNNDPEELEFQIDQVARILEALSIVIMDKGLQARVIDWLRTPVVMRARINVGERRK
jgi:hypothetical protein